MILREVANCFVKVSYEKVWRKAVGFYVQRTTGLLNCQMDFMVWCCDVITSTCLNMFSMNWTSFPRISFMSDLLIFAALLLPKNRCNTPQTSLLTFLETDKCKQVSVQTRLWPSYVPQGFNRKRVAFLIGISDLLLRRLFGSDGYLLLFTFENWGNKEIQCVQAAYA